MWRKLFSFSFLTEYGHHASSCLLPPSCWLCLHVFSPARQPFKDARGPALRASHRLLPSFIHPLTVAELLPDCPTLRACIAPRYARKTSETVFWTAASMGTFVSIGPRLGSVSRDCSHPPLFNSSVALGEDGTLPLNEQDPSKYANNAWAQAAAVLPNGSVVVLIHNEFDMSNGSAMWSTGKCSTCIVSLHSFHFPRSLRSSRSLHALNY